YRLPPRASVVVFSSTDPAATDIYTLSLHDALPISASEPTVEPERIWSVLGLAGLKDGVVAVGAVLATVTESNAAVPSTVPSLGEIGRAHVWTPVTWPKRMPSSASINKLVALVVLTV